MNSSECYSTDGSQKYAEQKEARHLKKLILYDSIYTEFKNRKTDLWSYKSKWWLTWSQEGILTISGHRGKFWGEANVPYLDLEGAYTGKN